LHFFHRPRQGILEKREALGSNNVEFEIGSTAFYYFLGTNQEKWLKNMVMNKVIICLLISIIYLSCSENENTVREYYSNGNIKLEIRMLNNQKIITHYYEKYENIIEQYKLKENDSCYYQESYFPNGLLKNKGKIYLDSLKMGIWEFYNANGYVSDVREYLLINNTSYLNQRWLISSESDTTGGNFLQVTMKDTVKVGEVNRIHFQLRAPLFSLESESFVLITKDMDSLNSDFSNQNKIVWDTIYSVGKKYKDNEEFKSYNHDVLVDLISKNGNNRLAGIFVEKEFKELDTLDFITRNIYFDLSYFAENE